MGKSVTNVKCLDGTRLLLTFDNGEQREIDIAREFEMEGIFEPLTDRKYFQEVRVVEDVGTIVWPNGADVCPDVLYEKSSPVAGSHRMSA